MKPNSPDRASTKPSLARIALVFSLPLIAGGCAASQTAQLDPRAPLPVAAAAFGRSVAVPEPRQSEDARGYAARVLGALGKADGRLRNDRAFYADVQRDFGGGR